MSASLPAVNARQMLAALRRAGFVVDRFPVVIICWFTPAKSGEP
jgi:hypothetical protein